MPTATAEKRENCGTGHGGFRSGNTCATGKKRSDSPKATSPPSKGQRLKSLEQNAAMATAHHENLARRGITGVKLTRAIDRAIALKRAAHSERQKKAQKLVAARKGFAAKAKAALPVPKAEADAAKRAGLLEQAAAYRKAKGVYAERLAGVYGRAADAYAEAMQGGKGNWAALGYRLARLKKAGGNERRRLAARIKKTLGPTGGERDPLDLTPRGDGSFGYTPKSATVPSGRPGEHPVRPMPFAPKPGPTARAPRPEAAGPAKLEPQQKALPAPSTIVNDSWPARGTEARARVAARLRAARAKLASPVREVPTDQIHADPERFQFKGNLTDAKAGVTDALHGVRKWDPDLAGILQVWKDPADGRLYVVNGHHRLALAKKLGAQKLAVRHIDAKDAQEARGKGALTNIAEGRGTSLDAAKFFRDVGINRQDLEARGIPMREKIATEGLALSGLAGPIFSKVVDQSLTPARAAVIGGSGLSHPQQMDVWKAIEKPKKGHELTDRELAIRIEDARAAGTVSKADVSGGQGNLFGDDDEQIGLGNHRAKVVRNIEDKLRTDKRAFGDAAKHAERLARANNQIDADASGKVADEAAYGLGIFNQLRNTGPIARHLSRAAERLARGERPKDVHADAYKDVLASLRDAEKF